MLASQVGRDAPSQKPKPTGVGMLATLNSRETSDGATCDADKHNGLVCSACNQAIGSGVRYACLMCADFDLCACCENDFYVVDEHFAGAHAFAKVRDSRTIDVAALRRNSAVPSAAPAAAVSPSKRYTASEVEKIRQTGVDVTPPSVSYRYHVSHPGIDDDAEALDLIKRMLRYENSLRLAPETVALYAKSQRDSHKTAVTEALQRRVVDRFLADSVAQRLFTSMDEGLSFLRGHAGNFPSHFDELAECAQYVKYTAHCVPGDLTAGSVLPVAELKQIALHDVRSGPVTLADVMRDAIRPLLVAASSAT